MATTAKRRRPGRTAAGKETSIGVVRAIEKDGRLLVDFPGNPAGKAVRARSAVAPRPSVVGREAVLVFENGDPQRPIVLALLHDEPARPRRKRPVTVTADGEEVILSAERELVLRCGAASITLTRAGKVLVRGTYVLTRSSGVNSIKGGSVQIN